MGQERKPPAAARWLAHLRKELDAVSKAPVAFAVCVLAVGGVLTAGVFWARSRLAGNTGAETAAPLPPAAPAFQTEQVRAEGLKELNDKLQRFEAEDAARLARAWPALNDDQIDEWIDKLADHKPASLVVSWNSPVDASDLFKSIQRVGRRLGFQVTASTGATKAPGIEVMGLQDSPAVSIIYGMLQRNLGCPVRYSGDMPGAGPAGASDLSVGLVIGERP